MNDVPHLNSPDRLRLNRNYQSFLFLLAALLASLVLVNSLNRYFDHDEFEHIHSAWYVTINQFPYLDFFEQHHPLLWYLLAPFLILLGLSTQTVMVLRILMFVFILGIAFFTGRIAEQVSRSRETGLVSSILLLSSTLFIKSGVEIRPDVPEVFFGLVSILCLFRYFQSARNRDLIISGLAAAVAFLFLQKIVLLLFCYAAIFIYKIVRKRISLKPVLLFSAGFSLPVILFLGGLIISGSLKEYLLSNWVLISYVLDGFSPWPTLRWFFLQNLLPWVIVPVSIVFIVLTRQSGGEIKTIVFMFLVLFLSVLLINSPYPQYYLPAIPLGSIASAYFLTDIFNRIKLGKILRATIVIILIAGPAFYLWKESQKSNHFQMNRIDYVLRNSEASDFIYDGNSNFNLFRPDLHYFWFSVGMGKGLFRYREMKKNKYLGEFIENRYLSYDICRLIRTKKPRFISSYVLSLDACQLRTSYAKTEIPRLYIRTEK
ncbi:MAG: glycosyltransferase family 39 protein [Proteobacteria bacterium]|nr:glycosyltransferase family 39 protein [Pseudomonadota bacterium]